METLPVSMFTVIISRTLSLTQIIVVSGEDDNEDIDNYDFYCRYVLSLSWKPPNSFSGNVTVVASVDGERASRHSNFRRSQISKGRRRRKKWEFETYTRLQLKV